ncbi:MAG: acetolactate synthase small subunit [Gemmatimonadales bacterium]
MPTWVVTVLMEDDLLALNRVVGIVRRRNLALGGVTWGPTGRTGLSRLAVVVTGDAAATERMANHFRKLTEVRAVSLHPEAACTARAHALVRVRVTPVHLSALLDAVALYEARVVEESAHDLVVEATGTAPFMVSFLRALEPFGVLDLARGSALALPPRAPDLEPAAEVPAAGAAPPRVASAMPA